MSGDVDPYSLEENYLRTDGRDVCHWCSLRPQEWVWGPYGTRVCDHCQQLAAEGRAHNIVDEIHARMTVRGSWHRGIGNLVDPETWHAHEIERIDRWLEVRTTCEPGSPPPKLTGPSEGYVEPEWLRKIRELPDIWCLSERAPRRAHSGT